MKKWIFGLLFVSSGLFAEEKLIVDTHFSPFMGAEDMFFFHEKLVNWDDELFSDPNHFPKRGWIPSIERALEIASFSILGGFESVTQHEVFGHGYRIRDLSPKAKVLDYELGISSGLTKYRIDFSQMTFQERTAISSGGCQAQAIFAHRIIEHWVEKQVLDAREAALYLPLQTALFDYIYTPQMFWKNEGHDISNYCREINIAFPKMGLTQSDLKKYAVLELLNPLIYLSYYEEFRYIATGTHQKFLMIPLGQNLKFLPIPELLLSPHGPEAVLHGFFLKNQKTPFSLYLKKNLKSSYFSLGTGARIPKLWQISPHFSLGATLDFWVQPLNDQKISDFIHAMEMMQAMDEKDPKKIFGGSFSLIGDYQIMKKGGIYGEVGYKTEGFLPGYSLKKSPILRVGMSLQF